MYILAPRATVKCGAHITCAHEEHEKAAACGQLRSSSTHGACSKARHACSMVCAAPSQQHDHTAEGHRVVGGKGVGALWTGDRARFRTFRNRGCLARLTPLFRDRAGQHPGVPWTVRHHFSSSGPPRARRPSCGWNEGRKVVSQGIPTVGIPIRSRIQIEYVVFRLNTVRRGAWGGNPLPVGDGNWTG